MRIFELKNKYRRLAVKDKREQKIVRQLSSCLIEKYSGFTQISIEYQKRQRKLYKPIDTIYKPTKRIEIKPPCFFFRTICQRHIRLFIQKEKKECEDLINVIIVITVINSSFGQRIKKDGVKTVQEYLALFITLIIKI